MSNVSEQRILDVTDQLWARRGEIDVDIVDGTFYWGVVRQDEINELRFHYQNGSHTEACTHSPIYHNDRLASLIPGTQTLGFDWDSIPMRGAFYRDLIVYGARPTSAGEMSHGWGHPRGALGYLQVGIRNAEWRGEDVERAYRRFLEQSPWAIRDVHQPQPVLAENEALQVIGLRLYRDGEYGSAMPWDPSLGNPSEIDFDGMEDEAATRVEERRAAETVGMNQAEAERWRGAAINEEMLKGYNNRVEQAPHERHRYGPFVLLSISIPIPPAGVVASYYDGVAIEQCKWYQELLGARNVQSVDVAIRTWATCLLMYLGQKRSLALWKTAQVVGLNPVEPNTYHESRIRILDRVPELKEFLLAKPE